MTREDLLTPQIKKLITDADRGDMEAMISAASVLLAGEYIQGPEDGDIAERVMEYIRRGVDAGDYRAYIMYADQLSSGKIVPRDIPKAIAYYEKAADSGVPFGNECIGALFYYGTEVTRDYTKAMSYFTRNKGKKSACTLYYMAEMYRQGLGVECDQAKAVAYYKEIVEREKDDPIDAYYKFACYRLGMAYGRGRGVRINLKAAVRFLSEADRFEWDPMYCEKDGVSQNEVHDALLRYQRYLHSEGKHWTYSYTTLLDRVVFDEEFVPILLGLRDRYGEYLVADIEFRNPDNMEYIQTVFCDPDSYVIEISIKSENDWGREIYRIEDQGALDAVDIFSMVLCEGFCPNLSMWRNVTKEIRRK